MLSLLADIPEPVHVFLREWVWWTLLNGFSVPLVLPAVLLFLVLVLFFRFGIGLGLPRLFWQPDRGAQFMVGIGIGAVLWQVFLAGYVFEEFATNFTVDRPPFCEVRPLPDASDGTSAPQRPRYNVNDGIAHPDFPGRFRCEPASVWSVWWYAGVVVGAAAAIALVVTVIVVVIQFFGRIIRWQISGWRPYERDRDRPPVDFGFALPIGAVIGWLLMTGLTFVLFSLEDKTVARPIGDGLIKLAGWGKAAERRKDVEQHIARRMPAESAKTVPQMTGSSASPQADARRWFDPYTPVYAAFVVNFAVIFVGSIIIIALPPRLRLFSPAVGIVLLLNIAVFGTILLTVFPPLAVSGNFVLIALLVLAVVAGRSYKFRFPNMPDGRKPILLEERYQELVKAEAEAGTDEDRAAEVVTARIYSVPDGGPAVRPVFSEQIAYPHRGTWNGPKPPLAIICLSGGGSRSAAWAMKVLTTLEEKFLNPGEGRPPVALPYHTRLITGASGGMITGAFYAASLEEPTTSGEVNRKAIPRASGGSSPITHADLNEGVRRDLLTPITHTLVNHDLPALFTPLRFNYDRGQAFERALEAAMHGQLSAPLASLGEGEAAGWRPSLIFAPMLVEDGRQLFLSNLDLRMVTQNRAYILGENTTDSPDDPEGYGLLSREGVEFFKLFPGATEFTIASAVRMSASFPYLLPGVMLPTNPPRRVVDAGYYDNFGVGIAASWVFNHIEWIEKNTSGVVIIQVRDGMSEVGRKREQVTDSYPSLVQRGLHWLTTPASGLWNSRMASNAFRNDNLLHLLEDTFLAHKHPPGYFATVVFELAEGDDVALNLSLTNEEIRSIEIDSVNESFNKRVGQLVNWWHARLAAGNAPHSIAQVRRE